MEMASQGMALGTRNLMQEVASLTVAREIEGLGKN
jgi:hypothetical protein